MICARSCTDHLFSAQIQPKSLPNHFFTSFMQLMHNAMRELQVWNRLVVICLNTPPRLLGGISCISVSRHPDPPFNQITQQGCQSNGLELRNPIIFIICWKWPRKNLAAPPKSPSPPNLLRIDSFIPYQSIAFYFRIPDM